MTISSETNKVTYPGNSATTVWNYGFYVPTNENIQVILTDSSGTDTTVDPTDYTVTGAGDDNGGTVTYPLSGSPIDSSYQLTIKRNMEYLQEISFQNQGANYPTAIEEGLDNATMQIQQLAEIISRALKFSVVDESVSDLPAAADRANKYLTFDDDGNPSVTAAVDASTISVSVFMESLLLAASAAAARTALGVGVTGTLGQAGADTILGNPSASTDDPSFNSLVTYIARLYNTRGGILRRGSSAWEGLALGTIGQALQSDGTDIGYSNPPIGERGFATLVITVTTNSVLSVAADWLTLINASNTPKLTRPVSTTIDTGVSGAGGLDTGSVANDTWYSVWVIMKNDGTVSAMLSTSATSPTMPSGYTFKVRVGWVRTNGSAQLYRTIQRGDVARYVVGTLPGNVRRMANGAVGSVVTPTWVAVAVGAYVPSTASKISVGLQYNATVAMVAPNNSYGEFSSSTNSPPMVGGSSTVGVLGTLLGEIFLESTNIYWASSGVTGGLYCYGWEDNL